MKQLQPGTVVTLEVVREAPFGYFLTNGNEDVLLHKNEQKGELVIGEKVTVFFIMISKETSATMKIPDVQIGKYGWSKVVDVNERLGVFVNIGINKDILIHKDDLPKVERVWPAIDGKLYNFEIR